MKNAEILEGPAEEISRGMRIVKPYQNPSYFRKIFPDNAFVFQEFISANLKT